MVQVDELQAAFEEKLSAIETQLAGHEGPFLLGCVCTLYRCLRGARSTLLVMDCCRECLCKGVLRNVTLLVAVSVCSVVCISHFGTGPATCRTDNCQQTWKLPPHWQSAQILQGLLWKGRAPCG